MLSTWKNRAVDALAVLCYAVVPPPPVAVKSIDETLDRLLAGGDSLARFGDGEFAILRGHSIGFQVYDSRLAAELAAILRHEHEGLLVALPDVFAPARLRRYGQEAFRFWRRDLLFTRRLYRRYCGGKAYDNAFVSRPYLLYRLTDTREAVAARFARIKMLWAGRDIVVVEGGGSRLGVGNDLFAEARSVERILCPAENAFARYDEILTAALCLEQDRLILVALGPTAKVLVKDLFLRGYRALDIGHLDIEYEWFLMQAEKKVPVPGKYVSEAGAVDVPALPPATAQQYEGEVRCRIP